MSSFIELRGRTKVIIHLSNPYTYNGSLAKRVMYCTCVFQFSSSRFSSSLGTRPEKTMGDMWVTTMTFQKAEKMGITITIIMETSTVFTMATRIIMTTTNTAIITMPTNIVATIIMESIKKEL